MLSSDAKKEPKPVESTVKTRAGSVLALLLIGSSAIAGGLQGDIRTRSETVYVPAYSHIHTHQNIRQALTSTLVVHNVDPKVAIERVGVRYHDCDGKVVREFLTAPVTLQPFQSSNFLTPISESAGGVCANYIAEWQAAQGALLTIIEAVMIGRSGTHGISFTSPGRVLARETDGTND